MDKIQLCIFDMDGLLLDSETVWYLSALACNEKYGYEVPDQFVLDTMGLNDIETRRRFLIALGEDFPFHEYIARTVELRREYLDSHPLKKKKGVDELLAYLDRNNVRKAVATSTKRSSAEISLQCAGIKDRFDHITYGDDLKESKPRPEIYLKAAAAFDIPKKNILAFEDSNNGILSAYNAGLKVVHIPDLASVEEVTRKKCFAVLNDLSEAIELIEMINSL